jgi:hypothetical protein
VEQELASDLDSAAFRALLPGVRAAWYLEKLEVVGFNPFHADLQPINRVPFQLRLAKAAFTNKF